MLEKQLTKLQISFAVDIEGKTRQRQLYNGLRMIAQWGRWLAFGGAVRLRVQS